MGLSIQRTHRPDQTKVIPAEGTLEIPSPPNQKTAGRETTPDRRAGRTKLNAFCLPAFLFRQAPAEQIHYIILEELARVLMVGNLAKDLGFGVQELPIRHLPVSAGKKLFNVNTEQELTCGRLYRQRFLARSTDILWNLKWLLKSLCAFFI